MINAMAKSECESERELDLLLDDFVCDLLPLLLELEDLVLIGLTPLLFSLFHLLRGWLLDGEVPILKYKCPFYPTSE